MVILYMQQYNTDIKTGADGEITVLPILETFFNEKLYKNTDRYALFDFENDTKLIELKTRNNKKDQYRTTMIGKNKINFACHSENAEKDVYFVFKFTDGLFYYKYDSNDTTLENGMGGRSDRGKQEYKPYVYIDINLLTKIQ